MTPNSRLSDSHAWHTDVLLAHHGSLENVEIAVLLIHPRLNRMPGSSKVFSEGALWSV